MSANIKSAKSFGRMCRLAGGAGFRRTASCITMRQRHANGATVVQEVEKSFSNQKVASSIPCRSVLEQDTEPLIAPDVQCAISVNVQCVYIFVSRFG